MNDKQRAKLQRTRASLKASGITTRRTFLRLTCNACNKVWPIRTEHPQMYTEHVVRTWLCPMCKGRSIDATKITKN